MLDAARNLVFAAGLAASCSTGLIHAQPPAEFEVASLKQGLPVSAQFNINLGSVEHGTLTLTNASLSDCLLYAYSLSNKDQLAGPAWIKDKLTRFDIVAKAPPDATNSQIRLMLRNLLNDRFRMAMHREQRVLSYMALMPGKKGTTLLEAKEDADVSANSTAPGRIVHARLAMVTLATLLARFLREPVLDLTGLPGVYQVKLEWTPDPPLTDVPAPDGDADFPAIRKAIEEQLGLRLEPRKGPLEILVVDSADRVPIGN
jgi:uncharacterized protein (TIGR03435 family)